MIIDYRCLLLAITGFAFVESSMTDAVPLNCTDVRINNGPLITPCVSEIILQKGQNFTLTCRGTTNIRFRQQEVSEEVTSNFKIVNTNSSILEDEYNFESTLNLYDVDQYAIGYYACSDDSVDANIVNSIVTEPENDEHVSYIYVYVNGTDSLFAPMREFIVSRSNKILIECRPTTPDVEVKLMSKSQNKTPKYSPKIGFILKKCGSFAFECQGRRGDLKDKKRIRISVSKPPEPIVTYDSEDFLENETFTLNCTTILNRHTLAELSWQYPDTVNKDNSSITENTNSGNVTEGLLYKNITIYNATKKHKGTYICVSSNSCDSKYSSGVEKVYHAQPFLNIDITTKMGYISRQPAASILFVVDAYPKATILFQKNGKNLSLGTGKYRMSEKPKFKQVKLAINPVDVTDNANFTLIASNGYLTKNKTFEQIIGAKAAVIDFGKKICIKGMDTNVKCDVSGYPLPDISWMFSYYNNNTDVSMQSTSVNKTSIYNETAYLVKRCEHSGNITCRANNIDGIDKKTYQLLVYDIIDGFGINTTSENKTLWAIENDVVTVQCLASIYEFNNVNWIINDNDLSTTVDFPNSSEFSYIAELKIHQITLQHTGNYRCYGVKTNGTRVYDNIQINVMELQPPVILDADDVDAEVNRYKHENLNCSAVGVPLPQINWYKDGELIILKNDSNVRISSSNLSRTAVNSTLLIIGMEETNVGTYECIAVAKNLSLKKTFKLTLKGEKEHDFKPYVIAIAVIILILIIMIVYLTLKIKKEKRFRKELAAAGLLYFKEGVTQSLNPDLGIDEQAELLPYDEKFEFPADKLILGVQLGAGAFGVVYKAEARGIVNAEETTLVAVKMVKKTADNMYIKALASELKIMVHLGKHINIVNLLGACTKNVGKRELVVIVEYCKYGNIHNYMQRHREVFIDQLDTDNKEKLGKVNRAYTSSSCGSTGLHSDYFGSTNTQDTDHTFLNTANTVRSVRKNIPNNNQPAEEVKASEGYMQPEWRSNYESDYSYDGRNPRPLTSRDLLAWAFQIARGMEYLASRKVLHGDLAARNILLADDNIVKICDFGLAKSIYKNDEYHKKENSPLPVKWLAIECMTDRIFSTQSDVWSFGIVLWELFTLAKTPYPNIHPASLLQFLSEGHRLDKPSYADDKLYGVMKKCWEMKPTLRPTFSQLQEILGTFLEENVRNHYVDLNITYMDKNVKLEGQEDYLAMMCAPDYNNMVTPSPHRYVNTDKSFFPPTPVKVDDEGYLQMSPSNQGIFSPRVPNTEFDFDPRKFNPKVSEAGSCGSELTPMLTLNNLPARSGSESDHEGNPPYLNACPRIDEEADEVFAPSLNDTKNAKNIQQSAVTNPTYITFDNIDEKPKDIINNYVNINVPNGLVK